MVKRKAEGELRRYGNQPARKRQKRGGEKEFLDLSDELLLRILSYLKTSTLTTCECVCKKLQRLSRDDELWREKYYNHFILPRAKRNSVFRTFKEKDEIVYSSRTARWLENSKHASLKSTTETNWKHLFKIKRNWECGRARRTELVLDEKQSPSLLAKVLNGNLYTVAAENGIRVLRNGITIASARTECLGIPTTLAVEMRGTTAYIVVGCDGGLIFMLRHLGHQLDLMGSICTEDTSTISSIALAWPYMVAMTGARCVSLYSCEGDEAAMQMSVMATFTSESTIAPSSINLRKTKDSLVAGIVYAFDSFNAGWCLGLQEIRMDLSGMVTDNRTTSSISNGLTESFKRVQTTSRSATTSPFSLHPDFQRPPTSLSYSGCYILAGLPDNTLMVYTVTSTNDKLEINVGRRLWGHTSAVAAAEVTSNGKAVSISAKSDEMRYWELEDLLRSHSTRTSTLIKYSTVNDAIKQRGNGLGLAWPDTKIEAEICRKHVSFDESQAIVIGERDHKQVVSCFTFA